MLRYGIRGERNGKLLWLAVCGLGSLFLVSAKPTLTAVDVSSRGEVRPIVRSDWRMAPDDGSEVEPESLGEVQVSRSGVANVQKMHALSGGREIYRFLKKMKFKEIFAIAFTCMLGSGLALGLIYFIGKRLGFVADREASIHLNDSRSRDSVGSGFICDGFDGTAARTSQTSSNISPTARDPVKNMRMELQIKVKSGKNMPEVNVMSQPLKPGQSSQASAGGCDPFVEVMYMKSNPETQRGGLNAPSAAKVRTHSKEGDINPVWNEIILLPKIVYGPDYYVNVILWDSNISSNMPIGYRSWTAAQFLQGLQFDPSQEEVTFTDVVIDNFRSLLVDRPQLPGTVVRISTAYLEVHKFKLHVGKATQLPKVDVGGSIDPFVEVRIMNCNPHQHDWHCVPGAETIWSGKTKKFWNNQNPTWDEDIIFSLAGNPAHYIVIAIMDADEGEKGKKPEEVNKPVGMTVVPMRRILSNQEGFKEEFKTMLDKIPGKAFPDLDKQKLARLSFSISHSLVISSY